MDRDHDRDDYRDDYRDNYRDNDRDKNLLGEHECMVATSYRLAADKLVLGVLRSPLCQNRAK